MKFINKFFVLSIIFLVLGILCKSGTKYRDIINYYLYEDNFAFSSFRSFYNKYLGEYFPFNFIKDSTVSVFNESLEYIQINKYLDGYVLNVSDNYIVPSIIDGIVIFNGYKENYGNVIIVMGDDGVNIWYGNISNSSIKIYDSIKKGDIIGEVLDNCLYMVFYKDNEYIRYDDYLK